MTDVTQILSQIDSGNPSAAEQLLPLVYDELRRLAAHQAEPARLSRLIRGELDWIVMKALEKDRNRRYETAAALASDVWRHLNDEPVFAVAPSRIYRVSKFVRRNKWLVITASALLAGLLAGAIGMAIGLVSQSRQRAETRLNLALSLHSQGRYAEAEGLYREGLASATRASAEDRQRVARTKLRLAQVVWDQGNPVESERLHRDALKAYRADFPRGDANVAHALVTFALHLRSQQRFEEAEPLLREAYGIYCQSTPANRRAIGESATHLANVLITLRKYAEAEPIAREAIEQHPLVPQDDLVLAFARLERGRALVALHRFPEAERELLEAERVITMTNHFHVGMTAVMALYSTWNEAEPGKGYDAKSREWSRKLIGTFVRLDATPANVDEVEQPGRK